MRPPGPLPSTSAQIHADICSHTLGNGRGFGKLTEIVAHVALGHADSVVAAGSHLGHIHRGFGGKFFSAGRDKNSVTLASHNRLCAWRNYRRSLLLGRRISLRGGRSRRSANFKFIFLFADDRNHGQDRNHVACFVGSEMDVTFGIGFDGEDGFVGFDFHHRLTLTDFCAIFDQPADHDDFLNGLSQLGDEELFGH